MGMVIWFVIAIMLVYPSCKNVEEDQEAPFACFAFLTFLSWIAYFLCMLIFRVREAGQKCSGDYLANPHLFTAQDGEPYLHSNGTFLWYSMIGQGLFAIMLFSGAMSTTDD